MLQKIYGAAPEAERRYSPAECIGAKVAVVQGDPDPMRMSMRRFTRLTNAFSKKVENHAAAISLHFCYYNFCRPHRSLRTEKDNRVTPAMAAGVTRCPMTIEELIGLLDSN